MPGRTKPRPPPRLSLAPMIRTATQRLATAVALLTLASATALAQRPDQMREPSELALRAATEQRQLVTAQKGIGWFGLLRGANTEATININGDSAQLQGRLTGTPAIGLAYDYRVTRVLSLGGVASYQTLRFHDFRDADQRVDRDAELRVNRALVGARVLFHYGRSERVEMYSGLRAGITVWGFSAMGFGEGRFEDIGGLARVTAGATPQFTIIPFGLRAYLTPQLNLGAELGWGSPHIAAVQLGYRF